MNNVINRGEMPHKSTARTSIHPDDTGIPRCRGDLNKVGHPGPGQASRSMRLFLKGLKPDACIISITLLCVGLTIERHVPDTV